MVAASKLGAWREWSTRRRAAVVAAIVLWLVTFAGCAIAGIPLMIREGVSLGQLRELAKHEKEELREMWKNQSADIKLIEMNFFVYVRVCNMKKFYG